MAKLDAGFGGVRRRLARIYGEEGSPRDVRLASVLARQELADASRSGLSADPADLQELTELLLDLRLPDEAQQAGELLVQIRDDAASSHLLSVAMLSAGRSEAGIEMARRAVRQRPDFVSPIHNLAVAHLKRGEILRARYWVQQGLTVDSEDAKLRRLRAYLRVHALRVFASKLAMMLRPTRSGPA
ncbi:MAG: hypothetical protein AAFN41_14010 [Planctomycetota bacterium]